MSHREGNYVQVRAKFINDCTVYAEGVIHCQRLPTNDSISRQKIVTCYIGDLTLSSQLLGACAMDVALTHSDWLFVLGSGRINITRAGLTSPNRLGPRPTM